MSRPTYFYFHFYLDPNGVDIYPDSFNITGNGVCTHTFLGEVTKFNRDGKLTTGRSKKKHYINEYGNKCTETYYPNIPSYPYHHHYSLGYALEKDHSIKSIDNFGVNDYFSGENSLKFFGNEITIVDKKFNAGINYSNSGARASIPHSPKEYIFHLESLKETKKYKNNVQLYAGLDYKPITITLWEMAVIEFTWYNGILRYRNNVPFSNNSNIIIDEDFGYRKIAALTEFNKIHQSLMMDLSDNFIDQLL